MRYCKKCGNQLSDDMLFCQKCGTKVEAAAKKERPAATYPVLEKIESTPTEQKVKNKNGVRVFGIIALVLIVIIFIATIGANNDNSSSDDPKSSTSTNDPVSTPESIVVLDVEKYGNISANELVALVGEPDEISQSTCQGAFEIPCVYYEYSNADTLGEVSFVLVNDQVIRFTSYSEYPYESKNAVLAQFGITKESSCAVAADTNVALRYRCPSAKVDDFWIYLIDGDTFEFLQITYDMEYYEEWYLPLTSSEEIEYKTDAELTMKSLLTSPKTADFPWYDWEYGKNLFYILVSSYVDAENAFGVEMRNTFTFVYSRLTGGIVLAIVNDKVVANNGYIAVDELIQQLYDEMKRATAENNQQNTDSSIPQNDSAVTPTETTKAEQTTPPTSPTDNTQSVSPSTSTPSFTGSTCLDINYNGDGMPASNVTNFAGTDMICVAGRFSGIAGENNVKIIWTCPDGYVFTDQQYCYENGDTLQSWKTAEDIGSGSASVSIVLDTTGETLATYYFTVTGAPTYTNDASNDTTNGYDDPYGEMDDVDAGLAYQDYLENLPSLDDFEWETDSSDLDGISTSLTDEELAALEAASGN